MSKKKKILIIALIALSVLYVIVLKGIDVFFDKFVYSKFTSVEKKAFEEWRTKPLHFDPARINPKPFHPDTVKAAEEYRNIRDTKLDKAIDYLNGLKEKPETAMPVSPATPGTAEQMPGAPQSFIVDPNSPGPPVFVSAKSNKERDMQAKMDEESRSSDQYTTFPAEFDPLLYAFEKVVNRPDYHIRAFHAGSPVEEYDGFLCFPVFDPWEQSETICSLYKIKIRSLIEQERYSESLERIYTLAMASHSKVYTTNMETQSRINFLEQSIESWYDLVNNCDDSEILRKSLDLQKKASSSHPFYPEKFDPAVIEHLGNLLIYVRLGVKADIQGKTGKEIAAEMYGANARFLENFYLPAVTSTEKEESTLDFIDNLKTTENVLNSRYSLNPVRLLMIRVVTHTMFYIFPERFTQEKDEKIKARLDLLNLETARRLFSLEKDREPESISEMVPEYIPDIPLDPFSLKGEPYKEDPVYHSIGSDHTDDKCKTFEDYQPFNRGDIFLRQPENIDNK